MHGKWNPYSPLLLPLQLTLQRNKYPILPANTQDIFAGGKSKPLNLSRN